MAKLLFNLCVLLMLVSFEASAQQETLKKDTVVAPGAMQIMQGVVQNDEKIGIPYATVIIPGTMRGTSCDSAGRFELEVTATDTLIVVTAIGYNSQKVDIRSGKKLVVINLGRAIDIFSGAVVVKTYKRKKVDKTVPEKFPEPFEANVITIYPNPVSTFANLTVKWRNPVSDDQLIEIYNVIGEAINKVKIKVIKPTTEARFQAVFKNTGNYTVIVTNSKTHKALRMQLMVN